MVSAAARVPWALGCQADTGAEGRLNSASTSLQNVSSIGDHDSSIYHVVVISHYNPPPLLNQKSQN